MLKNVDMKYLCTVIGNLSGIPVRLFRGQQKTFYYSLIRLSKDPMSVYQEEILKIQANVGYFVTRHFNYYGIVNSGDMKFIIGPTCQVANSTQELRELAFRADVPPEETDDFVAGMKSIVRMPLESVMQILCTVNYVLNDEKLELKDIAIFDSQQDKMKILLEQHRSARVFSQELQSQQTAADTHNTYTLEQEMLRMVRKGDTAALKKWISSAPAVRGGAIAADQLRQMKNTFVVTATLVSRAAIHGGMDAQDAFTLSDWFIQNAELLNSLEQISNLQYRMVLEFTEQVERLQFGKQPSRLSIDVLKFVRRHLSEPITVEAIAEELFLSRPYLSRKFKAETGETLTDFILKEKTEEAKRLLRYSDKSVTAIGSYLSFSSLGHFSRVFKKYVGKTPSEYKEKYGKL